MTGIEIPLATGLIVQACAKLYDGWRDYLDETPPLNESVIHSFIEETIIGPCLYDVMPSMADEQARDALSSFLSSVDFAQLATDATVFYLLGSSPVSSPEIYRRTCQLLEIHGLAPTAAVDVSQHLVRLLAELAGKIVPDDPSSGISSKNKDKSKQKAIRAALEDSRIKLRATISDQLAAIIASLDAEHVDLRRLNNKIRQLRSAQKAAHATITPPNADNANRVPFDDIYVPPTVTSFGGEKLTRWATAGDLDRVFRLHRRNVVLGSPGAGKSTLAIHLARIIAADEQVAGCEVAMLVVLREHGATTISRRGMSVARTISEAMFDRYQVSLTGAEIAFLCSSGRLLVIFDGVDELLDPETRRAVVTAIEAFAGIYDRAPMLVTARVIGYEQAPLNQNSFSSLRIAPFTNGQAAEYAYKWFRLDRELTSKDVEQLVASFMRESDESSDLRENPLLLSLMCGLYKYQEYLPSNRPQIYADCAQLLFDLWDRRRHVLRPEFVIEANVAGALEHLAHWVFESQARTVGVLEDDLIQEAAQYLSRRQFDEDHQAARAEARKFIEFCRGRAWVLTEVGATADGVRLYGFAHRTFLEYFTAKHLVQTLSEHDLLYVLRRRCGDPTWNLVCQLIVQLSRFKRRGFEDELVASVLDSIHEKSPDEQPIALSVCIAALRNQPLLPVTVRRVTAYAVESYLSERGHSASGLTSSLPQVWIGERPVAIANRASANEVVKNTLIATFRGSPSFHQTQLACHGADYLLKNTAAVSDLLFKVADPAMRQLVAALKLYTTSPWQYLSAIYMGGDAKALIEGTTRTDHLYTGTPMATKIRPVDTDWGLGEWPNLFEFSVMYASSMTDGGQTFFRSVLLPLLTYGVSQLRRGSLSDCSYVPHPLWWRKLPTGRFELSDRGANEIQGQSFLPLVAAIILCECGIERGDADISRLANDFYGRDWGNLLLMRSLISTRYGLDHRGPHFETTDDRVEWLLRWARQEATLAELVELAFDGRLLGR